MSLHHRCARFAVKSVAMPDLADGASTEMKGSGVKPYVLKNTGGVYSFTCRNVGNFKTYDECKEAGRVTGWRSGETSAYCSSLALK